MQLVAVILQTLYEFLDRTLRLERQQREAKGDVSPLSGFFGQSESLAELLDDGLSLFLLQTQSDNA